MPLFAKIDPHQDKIMLAEMIGVSVLVVLSCLTFFAYFDRVMAALDRLLIRPPRVTRPNPPRG